MKQTPFQLVTAMSLAFSNPQGDPLNSNWDKCAAQAKGVEKELKEFRDGILTQNLPDTRDALCDIMVYCLGAYHALGLDADADMENVVDCLFSRLCATREKLTETVEYYTRTVGIKVYCEGAFPQMTVKSMEDQTGTNGEQYHKSQFLKARGYRTPVFALPVVAPAV